MDDQNTQTEKIEQETKKDTENELVVLKEHGTVEVKTDGFTAEQMEQLEIAASHGKGFADPKVKEKAIAAAKEARNKRGPHDYLVTKEPDYKIYPHYTVENFQPTKSMLNVLGIAMELEHTRISDWMKEAGLTRSAWYSWIRIPGFREWWNEQFLKAIKSYENEWLTIGIKKMRLDFRYWESMGEKLFGYIKQLKVENTGTEEEQKLTSELLKLFESVNKEREARPLVGTAEVVELTEDQVKELNESNLKNI